MSMRTPLLGQAGRLAMAWYVLRGRTVIYRAVIRDGGIDLTGSPKAIVQEVQVYGAGVASRAPYDGPDLPAG